MTTEQQQQAISYIDWLIPKLRKIHDAAKSNIEPFPEEGKSQRFWFESNAMHNMKQEQLYIFANELYAVVATLKEDGVQHIEEVEKAILRRIHERLCILDLSKSSTNPLHDMGQVCRDSAAKFFLREFTVNDFMGGGLGSDTFFFENGRK